MLKSMKKLEKKGQFLLLIIFLIKKKP